MDSREFAFAAIEVHALISLIVVAASGALGAVSRFWLSGVIGRRIGETFPWGTLIVNISGSALIGAAGGWLDSASNAGRWSIVWMAILAGFLGGYTTVSSFALQTMTLARIGEMRQAGWNLVATTVLCVAAAAAAFVAVRMLVAS